MKKYILIGFLLFTVSAVSAQEIIRSTVSASGASSELIDGDNTYVIQHSVGQSSVTGSYFSASGGIRQGFIQPRIKLGGIAKDNTIGAVVFPNPFKSEISVTFNEELANPLRIIVYDLLGKVVFEKQSAPTSRLDLQLSNLAAAQYILLITSEEKTFKATILKN